MPEDPDNTDVVVPVIQEQLHADAVPVVTGGVRVTKQVHTQDEVLEQQLRTSHADIKRVKTDRVVDGPQSSRREGNTLIIPIVSEVLRVYKEWVVTEEIYITEREQIETVQQTVPVSHEEAQIERLDKAGNAIPAGDIPVESERAQRRTAASLVNRAASARSGTGSTTFTSSSSLLAGKKRPTKKQDE